MLWDSITSFLWGLVVNWLGIVGLLALGILELPKFWLEDWNKRLERGLRRFRPYATPLAVALIFLSVFVTYHNERTRHQETKEKLSEVRNVKESRLEIRTIDTTTKTNPDGTYTIVRLVEIMSLPRQGILRFIVHGKGIINLKVKSQGQLMTLYGAGGGTADSAFLEIQNPWGKYLVVVQTRNADDVIFDYSFE